MDNFDLKKYLGNNPLLSEANYLDSKEVTEKEVKKLIGKKIEDQGYKYFSRYTGEANYLEVYLKEVRDDNGNLYYFIMWPSFYDDYYHGNEIELNLDVERDKKGLKKFFSKRKRKEIIDLRTKKTILKKEDMGKGNETRKKILLRTPSSIKSMENEVLNKLNRASDPSNYTE